MSLLVKLVFILCVVGSFRAQDPRKRMLVSPYILDWPDEGEILENDSIGCISHGSVKRSDADGPFWANRGKKEPKYLQSKLYAQEPKWVYLSDEHFGYNEPFFVTRGKKRIEFSRTYPWILKELGQEKRTESAADPFFAARGKKNTNDF